MWLVRGIASVIFGVLTIVNPGASIAALVVLYGIYALADGAFLLGFAFFGDGPKAPYVVRGLISIAAGVLTFLYPGLTATSLYILIGVWAIAAGVMEIVAAISPETIDSTPEKTSPPRLASFLSEIAAAISMTPAAMAHTPMRM